MRIEILSDWPAEQLESTKRRRNKAEFLRATASGRHDEAVAALKATQHQSWWRPLRSNRTRRQVDAQRRVDERLQALRNAEDAYDKLCNTVDQQTVGVEGEQQFTTELSILLSDDWLLLSGYYNRRGEADGVLVGPHGVWAVEVKARNARLFVDGDRWWYEAVDNHGDVVRRGDATDRSGRTWARQVADVADHLAWWLDENGQKVTVRTAVLLIHLKGSVARCHNPSIDHVSADPVQLIDDMEALAEPIARDRADAIAELIRRDHHHNNRDRANG